MASSVFPILAFLDNLGTTELMICAIVALLCFGKRLPEVASQAGATLTKFRRSLDSAIKDSGVEQEIRKIKSAMPTDLSVRDVTRAAVRKFEDRMREDVIDPTARALDEAKAATSGAALAASTEERPAPPRPGIDPASQFGASVAGEPAPSTSDSTASGKTATNGTASVGTGAESAGRNGVDSSTISPRRVESAGADGETGHSRTETDDAERLGSSGIPPRALPPGSVPRG